VLQIIISITGTCDGKISRVNVSETLKKALKLELWSFILQVLSIQNARQVEYVGDVSFIYYNSGILRFADRQIFCIVS